MSDQAERLRLIAKSLQEKIRNQILAGINSCRVVVVTSGKGGVGKTNVALGLSLALAKARYRVMLFDADMGLANVDIILGLNPRYNLAHVFKGEKTIKEIFQKGPEGIQIIPGGSGIEELANMDPLALTQLLQDISFIDQKLDYLFIDTGAGISKQVIAFILAAEEVLIVTTPEPTALTDAYGLIKVFKHNQGKGKLKLIVNMVRNEREGIEAAQKLKDVTQRFLQLNLDVAGYIPRDDAVSNAVKMNQSYILAFPASPASISTYKIASSFGDLSYEVTPQGAKNFFKQLFGFLRGQGKEEHARR